MKLFDLPAGVRVRVTSRLVRWVDHGAEQRIGADMTWEGTTTNSFYTYKGASRRLIVDHTIEFWHEYGVWQRDCEVIVIE